MRKSQRLTFVNGSKIRRLVYYALFFKIIETHLEIFSDNGSIKSGRIRVFESPVQLWIVLSLKRFTFFVWCSFMNFLGQFLVLWTSTRIEVIWVGLFRVESHLIWLRYLIYLKQEALIPKNKTVIIFTLN